MTQPDWSARLVRVVAERIRRHRQARRMSTRAVADACAELGHPVPRSVLANLEGGRRVTISLPEVYVLARVLEVPPSDLMVPIDRGDLVEVLPGVEARPVAVLEWLVGRQALPGQRWESNDTSLYHLHSEMVGRWQNAKLSARRSREEGDEVGAAIGDGDADAALVTVIEARTAMRDRELSLPDLPPELARAVGRKQ